jgi:hypothetical protein
VDLSKDFPIPVGSRARPAPSDDGPAAADCPEHQGDQEKQKHDEKYDLGDSHGGGGDRSTSII